MQNRNNNELHDFRDTLDVSYLINVLIGEKKIIIFFASIFASLFMAYSFTLPDMYQSKALLAPVQSNNSMSGAMQNYSGLASLSGIKLPNDSSNNNNASKAKEKIRSLSFFEDSIMPKIFLPELMAVKSWDPITNVIKFDDSIYNNSTKEWVRNIRFPQTKIPSAQESYKIFQENHLTFKDNVDTGFISIAVKHQSPFVAQKWTELIVTEINSYYRNKDKNEADKAINYLNYQLSNTNLAEIKQATTSILQEQIKKLTLIEANEYYVFDYIDPSAIMESKIGPKRFIYLIYGFIFGLILSFLIIFTKQYAIKL